jgi:uncharacterized protein YcnI
MSEELTYKLNDEIQFGVIERFRDYSFFPVATKYTYTEVTGKVINIRDIEIDKLEYKTVYKNPELERSRYLITIKTNEGIKKYYDCRIVNVRPAVDTKTKTLNAISKSTKQITSTSIDVNEQLSSLKQEQLDLETEEVIIQL